MDLIALGKRVEGERLRRGWGKEEAGRRAGISSITWKRVEDGHRVQDANLAKILLALELDEDGSSPEPDPVDAQRDKPAGRVEIPAEALEEMLHGIRDLQSKVAELSTELSDLAARDRGRPSRGAQLRTDDPDPA